MLRAERFPGTGGVPPASGRLGAEENVERIIITGSQVRSETRFHFEVLIDDRSPGNSRPVTPDDPCIVPNAPRKIGFAGDRTENDR